MQSQAQVGDRPECHATSPTTHLPNRHRPPLSKIGFGPTVYHIGFMAEQSVAAASLSLNRAVDTPLLPLHFFVRLFVVKPFLLLRGACLKINEVAVKAKHFKLFLRSVNSEMPFAETRGTTRCSHLQHHGGTTREGTRKGTNEEVSRADQQLTSEPTHRYTAFRRRLQSLQAKSRRLMNSYTSSCEEAELSTFPFLSSLPLSHKPAKINLAFSDHKRLGSAFFQDALNMQASFGIKFKKPRKKNDIFMWSFFTSRYCGQPLQFSMSLRA